MSAKEDWLSRLRIMYAEPDRQWLAKRRVESLMRGGGMEDDDNVPQEWAQILNEEWGLGCTLIPIGPGRVIDPNDLVPGWRVSWVSPRRT